MVKGFNYYKMGVVFYFIIIFMVLSTNSVEASIPDKKLQASHASDASGEYCSHISCRRAREEIDPIYGVQKRTVPTGLNIM